MTQKSKKYKTIAVDAKTHELIDKLSKSNNKSNLDFVASMAKYFTKYGLDPESTPANLGKEIKLLDKHVIGFIRKQEELFLIPMLQSLQKQRELLAKLEQNQVTRIVPNSPNSPVAPQIPEGAKVFNKETLDMITETIKNIYTISIKLKFTDSKTMSYKEAAELSKRLTTIIK